MSHHGRAYSEKPILAHGSQSRHNYPIVVLVNRYTASAAEIVSGALQDHDRGWVLGETTFGKGLVQTVYPLSDNTGLALTTQHYYTPSGRLIQRDYSKMSFLDYYYGRRGDSERTRRREEDRSRPHGLRRRRHHAGRKIRRSPRLNPFQIAVLRKNAFFLVYGPVFRRPRGQTA